MDDNEARAYVVQVIQSLKSLEHALNDTANYLLQARSNASTIGVYLEMTLQGMPNLGPPIPTDALRRMEELRTASLATRALIQGWPLSKDESTPLERYQALIQGRPVTTEETAALEQSQALASVNAQLRQDGQEDISFPQ